MNFYKLNEILFPEDKFESLLKLFQKYNYGCDKTYINENYYCYPNYNGYIQYAY